MTEFFVDVRVLVDAEDIGKAYYKVANELDEHIMNSDEIREHDYIAIKQRREDFYDWKKRFDC